MIVQSKSAQTPDIEFEKVPRIMKGCDLSFLDQEFAADLSGKVVNIPGKRKGLVIESE